MGNKITQLDEELEAIEEAIGAEWADIYTNSGAEHDPTSGSWRPGPRSTGPDLAEASGANLFEVFAAARTHEWVLRWSVLVELGKGYVATIPDDEWEAASAACDTKDHMAHMFGTSRETVRNWCKTRGDARAWTQTQQKAPTWSKEREATDA